MENVKKISFFRKDRMRLFREIPLNEQGFALLKLSKKVRKDVFDHLDDKEIVDIIGFLDGDNIAKLLKEVNQRKRKKVILGLQKDIQAKVQFLLKFNPKTAANLVSLDYVQIDKKATFEEISKLVQRHEKKTGKLPALLVVEKGLFVGELPASVALRANKKEKISNYIRKIPSIEYDKDEKEVIATFEKNPHNKVVVLDEVNRIIGFIYSDDIITLIKKHSADSLQDFAGINKEEGVLDSAFTKFKNRYKWLILNLGTAFLAAFVVSLFENTIATFTLLAVYMPIVAGMGGNAGTQTLAVMVRGITLKQVELKKGRRVIANEMFSGAMNGLLNGILVAAVAIVFNKSPLLGLIIGIAMVVNLIIAGLFGALVPLILKSFGKDPASSATIFITTATDVFGFFIFLGLATILL